jgi:hypothetical protein
MFAKVNGLFVVALEVMTKALFIVFRGSASEKAHKGAHSKWKKEHDRF